MELRGFLQESNQKCRRDRGGAACSSSRAGQHRPQLRVYDLGVSGLGV